MTAFSFNPWYVGFTIGMWIAIIQLTIIIFIKYYQSYYTMSFTVQLSIILAFIIFAIWITIMAIFSFVKLKGDERTKILVAFCVGSCAYLLSVILGMAWMKTNAIDKRDSLPVSIKVRDRWVMLCVVAIHKCILDSCCCGGRHYCSYIQGGCMGTCHLRGRWVLNSGTMVGSQKNVSFV